MSDTNGQPVEVTEANRHELAEGYFLAMAQELGSLDLVDRGTALMPPVGTLSQGFKAMKIRLSPVESRHEKMVRVQATTIAMLLNRVKVLEAVLREKGLMEPLIDTGGTASGPEEPSDSAAVDPDLVKTESESSNEGV